MFELRICWTARKSGFIGWGSRFFTYHDQGSWLLILLLRLPTDVPQIPYPVESSKVQEVSHRAMTRWTGGDAENVGVDGLHPGAHHHPHHLRSRSRRSSFDGTVRLSDVDSMSGLNHGVRCDSCSQVGPISASLYKEADCHCAEDDCRHSIPVRELPFHATSIQFGLWICV